MFSTIQRPSFSLIWRRRSLFPPPMSAHGSSSAPMCTASGALGAMRVIGFSYGLALRADADGKGRREDGSRTTGSDHAARAAGLHLLLVDADRDAVDEDVAHAAGGIGGEPLGAGREVGDPADRPGGHGGGIEHDHVGPRPRPELAPVDEAE